MPGDFDRYNRIIRNLYTAVFEREQRQSNRILKRTFQLGAPTAQVTDRRGYITAVLRDFPRYYLRFESSISYVKGVQQIYYDTAQQSSSLWTRNPSSSVVNGIYEGGGLINGYSGNALNIGAEASAYIGASGQSGHSYSDFTFECILYFSANAAHPSAELTLIDVGPKLVLQNDRKLRLENSGVDTTRTSTNALTAGTRYHIVWVRNLGDGFSYLYVNGALADSWAVTSTSAKAATSTAVVGQANSQAWGGTCLLDEVAIYKHSLPAFRVQKHYDAFKVQTTTPALVTAGYWPTASLYADMTVGGTNTSNDDSAYRFATGVTATYPIGWADGIIRLRPRWAYNAAPTNPTIAQLVVDASNRLRVYYNSAGQQFVYEQVKAGVTTSAAVSSTHAAYSDLTLGWWKDSTTIGIALNGNTLTTAASSSTVSHSTQNTEFGNGVNPSDCDFHWVLWGYALTSGGLSSTRLVWERIFHAIHQFGNWDPDWEDIPRGDRHTKTFLWWCRNATHQPTSPLNGNFTG